MSSSLTEPNLVILGAQKSGTTSLHEYMKRHPDIFMSSPIKEPGYYLGDERAKIFWNRMGQPIADRQELLRERMLIGYTDEAWFGDASTYYTIGERSRMFGVPERMHQANPQMRMIYIMRDPYERIISNYWHCRAKGKSGDSLTEFLETAEGRMGMQTSQYHFQLQAYRQYFRQEQFLLLRFEDLLERPDEVMTRIWQFLEVAPLPGAESYPRYNKSVRNDEQLVPLTEQDWTNLQQKLQADLRLLQSEWGFDINAWELDDGHLIRAAE